MSKLLRFAVCLLAAPLALLSCGPDNTSKPADAGVPDAPQGPIVGGRLGAAIASAAAASSSSAAAKQKSAGDAPPENGVFAAGEADKRQPKDAPPKIDLLSEGEGTKVQLANKADLPEQKSSVTVSVRVGQQRTPSIDFALSIKPEKSKEKPKEPPSGAAPPVRMAATVTGATLPSMQGVAKEAADQIAKLKGTVIRYDFAAGGIASNYAVELPKGAGEGLDLVLDALVDALGLMTVVLPPKPVGVGAYWIVGDRGRSAVGITPGGINVVRYRVFKVQKIEGEVVTLALDLRQYAADQSVKVDNGGQKADLGLEAFDSQGKGTVVWSPSATLPLSGELSPHVTMGLAAPGAPPGRGPRVQVELAAKIVDGGAAPAK